MMNRPVVLLTGSNGFTGRHMARFLLAQNITVIGVGRQSTSALSDTQFIYERCDLTDPVQVRQLVNRYPAMYIIHLAGENSVEKSWHDPASVFQANAMCTALLLESVYQQKSPHLKRMLIVGSAQEYGTTANQKTSTCNEQSPTRPSNPYGRSKRIQTALAQLYARCFGLPLVISRTFNLIGPGATNGVCAQLARQVMQIERGLRPLQLVLGNLQTQRDFLDVRDAVSAYWLLLQHRGLPKGEIYNVCSGSSRSIGSLVKLFQQKSRAAFDVTTDPALLRNHDDPVLVGNNRKLCAATDWQPLYPIETSVTDMLNELRSEEADA